MSRFNLRKKPRISYYEPDEPNLDEYICKLFNVLNIYLPKKRLS